jgi:hypothetical protein
MEGAEMSKYRTLSSHLAMVRDTPWVAKFQEIEAVLGFPLPRSAYSYPAWWSNQSGDGHIQSQAWQSAGWRTGELDLAKQQVSFFREESGLPKQRDVNKSPSVSRQEGLTIAEAKARVAAYYDVSPENVEITIRG